MHQLTRLFLWSHALHMTLSLCYARTTLQTPAEHPPPYSAFIILMVVTDCVTTLMCTLIRILYTKCLLAFRALCHASEKLCKLNYVNCFYTGINRNYRFFRTILPFLLISVAIVRNIAREYTDLSKKYFFKRSTLPIEPIRGSAFRQE